MWLARRVALMRILRLWPYILISLFALSAALLWAAVLIGSAGLVQTLDVITVFVGMLIGFSAIASSAAYLFTRFESYWISGFPIMLGFSIFAYAILKTSLELAALAVLAGASLLGYMLGRHLHRTVYRVLPLMVLVAFVLVSEYPVAREWRALTYGLCMGLFLSAILKYRSLPR